MSGQDMYGQLKRNLKSNQGQLNYAASAGKKFSRKFESGIKQLYYKVKFPKGSRTLRSTPREFSYNVSRNVKLIPYYRK
jgi:hypothetical protein